MVVYGGIEGGGTTFVLSVSRDDVLAPFDHFEYGTTSPEETLDQAIKWLRQFNIDALGIAMFGPLDLNTNSKTFGFVTSTPKEKWRQFDVLGYLRREFPSVPMCLQSDVNAAALAELVHGGHGDVKSSCYVTVGTGVGAGICIDSVPLVGASHPEAGHISVPLHPVDLESGFQGTCPFHGNCIEGLCSAASIAKRKQCDASQLADVPDDDIVWDIVGEYLGSLAVTLTLICSPEVIVFGGGVLKRLRLFEVARKKFETSLAGYVSIPKQIDDYIVPTKLKVGAGVVGSLELAHLAHTKGA